MALEPAENTLDMRPSRRCRRFSQWFRCDLHHADVHAGLFERGQSLLGVVVYGVGGFVRVAFKGFPRLGHLLLAGVGPEIGVMEVDQHFQPCCRGSLGHGQCAIGVDVAAAISLASAVNGSFHTRRRT